MLRWPWLLGVVAVLGSSAFGCVNNDAASVYITGNALLDAQCKVQQDQYLIASTIDVQPPVDYQLNLAVHNQILARPTANGSDPNAVTFNRAEVTLYDVTGAIIAGPYSTQASGVIPSATDTQTAGVGTVNVKAIPSGVRATMPAPGDTTSAAGVSMKITLFGETNGGNNVETAPFYYDLDVCNGCLCTTVASNAGGCYPLGQDGRLSTCP